MMDDFIESWLSRRVEGAWYFEKVTAAGLILRDGILKRCGWPPLKKIKQTNQHPANPKKVKAEVEPFANNAVRHIVTEIGIREV
jgi:hypothetical protein